MAGAQAEQAGGAPPLEAGEREAEAKLILYHWTHSFSSQKVRAGAGGAGRASAPDSSRRARRPGPAHWTLASGTLTPGLPPGQGVP